MVPLLSAILRGTPKLADAACVGRPGLWDPPGQGESLPDAEYRQGIALSICHSCDCRVECGRWIDSLPVSNRPAGVVAGRTPGSGRTAA